MTQKIIIAIMMVWGTIHASGELGLVGGGPDIEGPAYVAFVGSDGTLIPLSGGNLPATTGAIHSVAINNSGAGLIGGASDDGSAYAALVAPNGVLTQLSGGNLPSLNGIINGVAINNDGIGLIVGGVFTGGAAYAASVSSASNTLTALTGGDLPTDGFLYAAAINNLGTGLIGGLDSSGQHAYAALVSPNESSLTQLTGGNLPTLHGAINSVAINDSGAGLLGGGIVTGGPAYVALVSPGSDTLTELTGGALPTNGFIYSVAMNNSGAGLVGGYNLSGPAYVALVSPNSTTLTELSGANLPTNGEIHSVSINASGAGLIGGEVAFGFAYAALVAPDGTLTQLTGGGAPIDWVIESVAINDAGVGLIGGSSLIGASVVLVAPNGTLTELTGDSLSISGTINSVSITSVLNNTLLTPRSIGPYSSMMNMQLAASYALNGHLSTQSRRGVRKESSEIVLLADAAEIGMQFPSCQRRRSAPLPPTLPEDPLPQNQPSDVESKYTLWMEPFGDYVHQKAEEEIPSYTNQVAGVLVAFDDHFVNGLVGGGVGYAYNYIHISESLGHGSLQEEMAYFYGSYRQEHFWMDVALWGGLYQLRGERHTLPSISSTSRTHGWILDPHLKVASPFAIDKGKNYSVEPFVMFDWVNSWQSAYSEKGSSGLNLSVESQYASLLRSEGGFRFYELFLYNWGKLLVVEGISYVNQAPFHFQKLDTFFVGSSSTFPIATGSSAVQNLGGAEFRVSFVPCHPVYPYGTLAFQGEFGSSYQSYFISLELGKNW